MARDRRLTEKKLIDAAGRVLARDGFGQLGVNAVAREAGLDKVLIYRYFKGLSGLIKAYAKQGDFWPDAEELLGEPVEDFRQKPLADQIGIIMENYVRGIRNRPLTLEILSWEMVERNELTAHLEDVREKLGIRLTELLGPDNQPGHTTESPADAEALVTIFSASINYLAARSRNIKVFNRIAIQEDEGWKRLTDTMKQICNHLL